MIPQIGFNCSETPATNIEAVDSSENEAVLEQSPKDKEVGLLNMKNIHKLIHQIKRHQIKNHHPINT